MTVEGNNLLPGPQATDVLKVTQKMELRTAPALERKGSTKET